jgi:8-oxo-dGTP pyrophosphatase MutT (NUDIX family)
MLRALIINRHGEVLLARDAESGEYSAIAGEQRSDETAEHALSRLTREQLGIELPFFTKLLERGDEAWFLVALDRWPPVGDGWILLRIEQALELHLEPSSRQVLTWFDSPAAASAEELGSAPAASNQRGSVST